MSHSDESQVSKLSDKREPRRWVSDKAAYIRVGLILMAFVMRLIPLGRYVTPDEPAWVERSIRFSDALAAQDWASVPSTGHPGVTTMWLGAAGVAIRRWTAPAESISHLDWIRCLAWLAPENGEAFGHLAFFLPYGRIAVALTTSLALVAAYSLLRRLFNDHTALLAVGLLSFEPFFVGHTGLLHTDGLLAAFSMLSVLSLLMAVRDSESRASRKEGTWVLVSGVTGGLALLTKSLAGYLVLFTGVVLTSAWLLRRIGLSQAIGYAAMWGVSAALLYAALYPAMWGDPLGTIRDLLTAPTYQSTAALMPTFFAGRTALRHGPQFYLVALPFRLSPVVLIGSLLSLWVFSKKKNLRPELAWLGGFCVGYLLLLALNVKRYQRYLLPAFGPLAVTAALGLSHWWRSRRWDRSVGLPSLILVQFLLLLPFATYPLTSFNLLLGGPWVGRRLLSADWGEGMGAAAHWLNQRPDAETRTVASFSVPPLASLFDGETVPMERAAAADYFVRGIGEMPSPDSPYPIAYTATVGLIDHAVVLTNTGPSRQANYLAARADPDDLILVGFETPLPRRYEGPGTIHSMTHLADQPAVVDWLREHAPGWGRSAHASTWLVSSPVGSPITAAHLCHQLELIATPIHTSTVAGATITEYVSRSSSETDPPSRYQAVFAGELALVDGIYPETVSWPEDLRVTLRWRALVQPSSDYRVVVALRDAERRGWGQTEMLVVDSVYFPTSAWRIGQWSDAPYDVSLPPGVPPGRYIVEVSLYRGDTGAKLGAAGPEGRFRGTQVPIGEVIVTPPQTSPTIRDLAIQQRLDVSVGPLTLLGLDSPAERVLSGDSLSLVLYWGTDAAPKTDYRADFYLVSSDDEIRLVQHHPLSPYVTSRWHPGDRFQTRYRLRIPPDLPPGRYQLMLDLLAGGGESLVSSPISLASLDVLPRERSFDLPDDVGNRTSLTFGESIHLRGYELAKEEVRPGREVSLTLYWQADGPTEQGYTRFVHLLGPDGRVYGQVDSIPGNARAPTTSWAADQVIVEDVAIPVASDAPAGAYHLEIGFYDPAYGDRLPVNDVSDGELDGDKATLPIDILVLGDAE